MTDSDYPAFLALAERLAQTLQATVGADTYEDLFASLKPFRLEAVQDAAETLRDTARYFPRPVEWREAAETSELTFIKRAIQPARREPWHCDCTACDDTGWQTLSCTGDDERCPCRKDRPQDPHTFARMCECRERNRTYQRHLMAQRTRQDGRPPPRGRREWRGGGWSRAGDVVDFTAARAHQTRGEREMERDQ
jgi:hypothetical protein